MVELLPHSRAIFGVHGNGGGSPTKYETWEEQVEPVRVEPDPLKLNEFITVQFSPGAKNEILKWMR
jgi:hypothetical protein